ncbi:MAG: hypothetical protein C0180_05615 [Aciduliprofundum sp.]|nr:MAG: hypothetical protein C0180_05615 [Aciduliprofundum sp.]
MKKKYISIFDTISFFIIYTISIYMNFFQLNIYLTLALLLIFITGIILSNMNGPEENGRILDLMNRLFLAIYIIVISLVIYIIFSLLSIPMFTNLILGAIYVIFLIIIFIVSMRDFFLIISGEGA